MNIASYPSLSLAGCRLAQEPTAQNTTSRAKLKDKDFEAGVSRKLLAPMVCLRRCPAPKIEASPFIRSVFGSGGLRDKLWFHFRYAGLTARHRKAGLYNLHR